MDRDLIGWVLVAAGAVDLATGFLVLAPRLPEERRRAVVAAVASSGVLMVSLGACVLGHVL